MNVDVDHGAIVKERQMKKVAMGAMFGAFILMASWQFLPVAAEAG